MKPWTPKPELYDFGRPFPAAQVQGLFLSSRFLQRVVPFDSAARVYEPGCGTGRVLLPLACQFPSWRFFGCDLSTAALDVCRERCHRLGVPNVSVKEADICEAPFADPFDLLIHSSVLHAVTPWRDALANMLSSLRPNGGFALIGDCGDIYDQALGRPAQAGSDKRLAMFWGIYRDARQAAGAPDPETSQVGAFWDLESSEMAAELERMGLAEVDRTTTAWLQSFTIDDLYKIVSERCYSSMFTVERQTYDALLRVLRNGMDVFSMTDRVVSRHRAICRFFSRI